MISPFSIGTPFTLGLLGFIALALLSGSGLAFADIEDAEEHSNEGHIELSREQIARSGIELVQAGSGNIREILPAYGKIATNAERVQSISARFEGVITAVTKKVGDRVRAGETLLEIEANESLRAYAITSSIDGILTQRTANVGEQTAQRVLLVVQDFSTVWIEVAIFPRDASRVYVSQYVRIKSVDAANIANGEIIYISPYGSSANQAITARVEIDNPNGVWRPGNFVSTEITLAEIAAPLVVHNEALQIVDGENVVFVKSGDKFEPRVLTLGISDGELSEVSTGLQAGETYVNRNSFVLKSELGKGEIEDDD